MLLNTSATGLYDYHRLTKCLMTSLLYLYYGLLVERYALSWFYANGKRREERFKFSNGKNEIGFIKRSNGYVDEKFWTESLLTTL